MPVERIEPGTEEWSAWYANHIVRYEFALRYINGATRVLDAACGAGYGSRLIAEHTGASVVGVDASESALDIARKRFAHPRATFISDDCHTLAASAALGPFDAVISIETIEHLRSPEHFLRQARSLLRAGSPLVASTPNRLVQPERVWDYHEREYSPGEFRELLSTAGFSNVRLFGQRFTVVGQLRSQMRAEINRLRFNPLARLGFAVQRVLGRGKVPPPLPEQPEDFEIVPVTVGQVEDEGLTGPFVLLAVAEA